jgi:hypothetical protein
MLLRLVSFRVNVIMLKVANKPFVLSVIMLDVIVLSVIMLNVVMLSVVMLSVVMLTVVTPKSFFQVVILPI